MRVEGRVGVCTHSRCHPLQDEAGTPVQSISEDKRAVEPTLGQEGPDSVAPSLAKQAVECTSGDEGPTPCSTHGELTQKEPSSAACRGEDLDSGLKLRSEVELETCCVESRLTLLPFLCSSSALACLGDFL